MGQTRWTPDGTQAPTPPPVFEDPLAGLVTGAKAGADITGDPYDNMVVPVATPVELDDDASRAIMAVLDDDGPQPEGRPVPLPLPPPSDLSAGVVPGMVAEPERRPARLRVRQALGGYPKDAAKRRQQLGDRRQELMAARFGSRRAQDTQAAVAEDRRPASKSNIGGMILGLILLAAFGIIALQVIISIVESIGTAFE